MSSNPQSDRLDSLTRGGAKTNGASKPGLKFKPKAVARRTKEDRDASAPSIESNAAASHRGGRGGARGGRGGNARGGMRGGRNLAGTHVVQAGPLASGNAIGDFSGSNNRSTIRGVTPEYLSSLGRKSSSRGGSAALDSDDEGGADGEGDGAFSKIDMSKDYKFDSQEVDMFPVRAPRADYSATSDEQVKKEGTSASSRESSPEILQEDVKIKEDTPVKEEEGAKDLQTLLQEKSAHLQTKLESLNIDGSSSATTALDDQFGVLEDEVRIKQDYKEILEQLVNLNNDKEKLLFVQLPHVLPEFESATESATTTTTPTTTTTQKTISNVQIKPESSTSDASSKVPPQQKGLEGQIGHLRVHKSGKLTLKIGDVVMDVGMGSQASFLQQVVLVDHEERKSSQEDIDDGKPKSMKMLGHVSGKIDVIPRFDWKEINLLYIFVLHIH